MSAHRTRRARTTTGIVAATVAFSANAWASEPSLSVLPAVPQVPVPAVPPAPVLPNPVPSAPPATPSLPVGGIAPGSGSAALPGSSAGSSTALAPAAAPFGSAAEPAPPGSAAEAAPAGSPAAAAAGGSGWAGGAASPQGAERARREARRRAVYERRLRRTVARLSGCLYGVAPLDRRVLVLRGGPGRARPHSRAAVARRLELPLRRVARSERRGLRALRATNRFVGCGATGRGSRGELVGTALPATFASAPWSGPPVSMAGRDRARDGHERSRAGAHVLGARAEGSAPPLAAVSPSPALPGDGESGGSEPLVLLAFAAATIATAVLAARLLHHESGAAPAAGPPAPRQRAGAPPPHEPARHDREPDPRDWEPPPAPWSRS